MADIIWEPNSEQVNFLAMITNNETAEAKAAFVRALNQHNGNTERVVDEYYSASSFDAFASKYTYDPNAWDTDRDGGLPGLVVQGPDEHPPHSWDHINGLPPGIPPSRPPSRTTSPSNKAPDWTLDNSLGVSAPESRLDEDKELQAAIALSMRTTPQPQQESGVTTVSENFQQQSPVFGPATRDDHKEDEWAMIRASPIPMDAQPFGRKRESASPVFLRCRQHDPQRIHRLGPLIMLLHEIPAARNFFLLLQGEGSEIYSHNAGWWRGEVIANPSAENTGTIESACSLLDELKRLMAFLDTSDRSYGTADSLFANQLLSNSNWDDPTVRFFENLYNYTNTQELPRMWTSVKVESKHGVQDQHFAILDFAVQQATPEPMRNLYSQWDHLFWIQDINSLSVARDDQATFACIQKPSKVMTMRVTTTEGLSIEVPEVLYIDRYLESHVEIARSMRDQMSLMWRILGKYQEKVDQLTRVTTKTGRTADSRQVLKRLIMRSEGLIREVRERALWKKHEEEVGTDKQIPYLPVELLHLLDEIQLNDAEQEEVHQLEVEAQGAKLKLTQLDAAFSRINSERDECIAILKRLNQTLTVPSDNEAMNPTHKYTLRGVVTSPCVVYVCLRQGPEPFVQIDNNANLDEWRMVTWDDNERQVKHERITFEKVARNMFTEVDTTGNTAPILVYATDEGLTETPITLSAALQTFVKHDNRLFKQELIEQPEQREKKRVGFESPQSPAKRQRSDSGDSMDSNRASLGDMSDGDRARMVADQMMDNFGGSNDSGVDTEMTDMQPISEDQMANEIAAHMPPTPSLSADGSASPPIRRSAEQLANMSLGDANTDKAPEMEELQAPFIVRRPASAQGSLLDQQTESVMNWPVIDETTAISGGSNPEEFYHPPKQE